MLRQFGFSKVIVDMIWRLVSNNWYAVVIKGKTFGLFKSTRGLKYRDPLPPTLFIIVAEVLSWGLNLLNEDPHFIGYGLPKWSLRINHLACVDDTILFGSGDMTAIRKMMKILYEYEHQSLQKFNKSKSAFFLHDNTPL